MSIVDDVISTVDAAISIVESVQNPFEDNSS